MPDRLPIPRYRGRGWLPKGHWRRMLSDGAPDLLFACPECGTRATLDEHGVSEDGAVDPSVVCPRAGCTFHRMIRLEEWEP